MFYSTATKPTFTVDEAAELLGVHRQTLYGAIRRGEIPAVRIGRRVLLSRHVLEQLLEEGTAAIARPPANRSGTEDVTP